MHSVIQQPQHANYGVLIGCEQAAKDLRQSLWVSASVSTHHHTTQYAGVGNTATYAQPGGKHTALFPGICTAISPTATEVSRQLIPTFHTPYYHPLFFKKSNKETVCA